MQTTKQSEIKLTLDKSTTLGLKNSLVAFAIVGDFQEESNTLK